MPGAKNLKSEHLSRKLQAVLALNYIMLMETIPSFHNPVTMELCKVRTQFQYPQVSIDIPWLPTL